MTVLAETRHVVPRDWRLLPALAAGGLWLSALGLLALVPQDARYAHLYALWAHEGIGWVPVIFEFLAAGMLLAVAQRLSVIAHGRWGSSRACVRWVRGATWCALGLLFFGVWVIDSTLGQDCFRTCAPFPR